MGVSCALPIRCSAKGVASEAGSGRNLRILFRRSVEIFDARVPDFWSGEGCGGHGIADDEGLGERSVVEI